MEKGKLIITPKTKVLELIETYPQLEEVLIKYVPAFGKLKNPVLRKTVAKIATLQQAASIGNVKTGDLINTLRKEVGQELLGGENESVYNYTRPEWINETLIEKEMDISTVLAQGEQPVNYVISDLSHLPGGKIYKVVAPFLPAPLIDKASSLGIKHWVCREEDERFLVYFFREMKH